MIYSLRFELLVACMDVSRCILVLNISISATSNLKRREYVGVSLILLYYFLTLDLSIVADVNSRNSFLRQSSFLQRMLAEVSYESSVSYSIASFSSFYPASFLSGILRSVSLILKKTPNQGLSHQLMPEMASQALLLL